MDRSLMTDGERRGQSRASLASGHAHLGARLRTGSPLRVLNTSPDGMLVESPARLLPGRQVDLVLQSGAIQEQAPWVVIHSRVGCIRGAADLRYRVGLRRAAGSGYSRHRELENRRNRLPTTECPGGPGAAANAEEVSPSGNGTKFGREKRT